jgi:hypothetical protein
MSTERTRPRRHRRYLARYGYQRKTAAVPDLRQRRRRQVDADRPPALRLADRARRPARGDSRRTRRRATARPAPRSTSRCCRRPAGRARAGHHDRRRVPLLRTPRRKFIIADTPGHVQYTRNMATGASNCDLAIILIDARQGVLEQTRRHSFICSLLGIKHFVSPSTRWTWSSTRRRSSRPSRRECRVRSGAPAGARRPLHPDVGAASARTSSHRRRETCRGTRVRRCSTPRDGAHRRRPQPGSTCACRCSSCCARTSTSAASAGTLASGVLRKGDEIAVLPSGRRSAREAHRHGTADRDEAFRRMAVTVTLDRRVDISRGDMIARPNNAPSSSNAVEAMVVWLNEDAAAARPPVPDQAVCAAVRRSR